MSCLSAYLSYSYAENMILKKYNKLNYFALLAPVLCFYIFLLSILPLVMCITVASFALYQEQTVFGKMKMDPAKRAQSQNAG
jgi:hypothetical protein